MSNYIKIDEIMDNDRYRRETENFIDSLRSSPVDGRKVPRITFYNWRDILNQYAGGAEKYCYEMAWRLARDGYQITWISSGAKGLPRKSNFKGINIIRIGNIFTVFFLSLFRSRKIHKNEVIVDSVNAIPFFDNPLAKKVVLIHHFVPFQVLKEKLGYLAPFAFFFQNVFNPIFYGTKKVITVSDSTMKELISYGYKDPKVVKLGTDMFDNSLERKKNIIVAPGPLRPWKNHYHIIKAFSAIPEEYKLIIFGNPETLQYEAALRQLASDMGLSDRVEFLGKITEETKNDIYRESKFAVFASAKEGWGLSCIEAQAFSCPVVAYDVSGIRDSVRQNETGLLVEYLNIQALSNAMLKLINDDSLYNKLSIGAYKWARSMDWDACYMDFLDKTDLIETQIEKVSKDPVPVLSLLK